MNKISPLLLIFLLVSTLSFSQFYDNIFMKAKLSDEHISRFKATQTVFFVNEKAPGVDQLKSAVKAAWTLTPLMFDDIDNLDNYTSDPKYSYFILEGQRLVYQNGATNTTFYVTLRMFEKIGKKNKIITKGLATIELYPSIETMKLPFWNERMEDVHTFYKQGVFYNWNPVLISANVKAVETNLKNGYREGTYDEYKIDDLSQVLSKDTLYVPQPLMMNFYAFTGKEEVKEENVFDQYKYKYRICTDAEIYEIFQVQKRGKLIFEYVKSSSSKIISIYNTKEGKKIYKRTVDRSYNLKGKDIEKIK